MKGRTFDEVFPDATADQHGGACEQFEGSTLIKVEEPYLCCVCQTETTWLDISFQAPLCSVECSRKLWKEYFDAASKQPPAAQGPEAVTG